MGMLLFVLGVFIVLALVNLPAFVLSFIIGFGLAIYNGQFEFVYILTYSFMVGCGLLLLALIGAAASSSSGGDSTLLKMGVAGVLGYFIGKGLSKL